MTKGQILSMLSLCLTAAFSFIRSLGHGFNVSHSLGVKSGIMTAPSGSDAAIKATAAATPAVKSLAEALRDGFSAAEGNQIGIINLATRKITFVPAGTDISAVTGATGMALSVTLDPDDVTKAGGGTYSADDMGATLSSGLLDELVTTQTKPNFTGSSLLGKIEDIITDPEGEVVGGGASGVVVVDQGNNVVKVYEATLAQCQAVNGAALLEESAELVQTLTAAGGRQFFE